MTGTMIVDDKLRSEEAGPSGTGADGRAMFETVLVGVDGTSTGRDAIALGEPRRGARDV